MKIVIELIIDPRDKEHATYLMYKAVDAAQEPIRKEGALVRTGYGLIERVNHE